ncbi:hypothetical protein BD413DRAFT_542736, partial [Trametes elegans]
QPIVWISIPSSTHKSKPRSSPRSLRKFSRLGNGDASDNISKLAIEKPPTCKEILQAALMEFALASFTRQTRLDTQRAMKETTITQYFSRQ